MNKKFLFLLLLLPTPLMGQEGVTEVSDISRQFEQSKKQGKNVSNEVKNLPDKATANASAILEKNQTIIAQNLEQIKNKKTATLDFKRSTTDFLQDTAQWTEKLYQNFSDRVTITLDTQRLVNAKNLYEGAKDLLDNPTETFKKVGADTKDIIKSFEFSFVNENKKQKVKRKKNVFYEIKTKNRYTKFRERNRLIVESFYVLKEHQDPEKTAERIVYFDKTAKVMKDKIKYVKVYKHAEGFALLHGTYQRYENDILTVNGIYYKGTKHGRWEYYYLNGDLKNKEYWYKGIPKRSRITYYDRENNRIKEIIPIQHGARNGIYRLFYESGNLSVKGDYIDNIKVDKWYEFFDRKATRRRSNIKKVTQHVSHNQPYNKNFIPSIIREYDEKGQKKQKSKD